MLDPESCALTMRPFPLVDFLQNIVSFLWWVDQLFADNTRYFPILLEFYGCFMVADTICIQ